jgi:predicted amidohydrolase YtcJ
MKAAAHRISVATLLLALTLAANAAPTLLENVDGYTLAGSELKHFSGLVFEHGRVVETGDAAALHRAYPSAKVIDGRGRGLLPGLIDAHGHIVGLGVQSQRTDLTGTRSLTEAQQRIRAFRASHPHQAWLLGGGWNQVLWGLGRFPLATELDAVEKDRPAVMERVDGHAKWLNSAALRAAGITKETADPVGGRIERDAAGNPSGVLVDKAQELLDRVAPPPTEAERRGAVLAALKHMNSVGLTSAVDAGSTASDVALYRQLADEGRLSVRIYAMIADVGADFAGLARNGPLIGYHDEQLSVRAVKLFADGALGSRGAALTAPYADSPGQHGLLFVSTDEMEKKIETALRAGYQVGVHAIGDAANHQVLDAFEAAYRVAGGRELRNRIEHAQIVAPADIPRFKQLDLIASMQPTHATSDMNMAEDRLGRERLRRAYAWRTFLNQGTRIAGGSDFPVESDNPFFGLYSAVTRTDHAGQPPGGWHAEEAMTLVEAFRAFTLDAAYAEHLERSIGSLEPGKWADFILTDRSLFAVPPSEIWKIRVDQTWMAGRRVH